MSGHSKWSKVKHKKAIEDKKKGKIFSKLARLISIAAKEGGGKPEMNTNLKMAIDKAKSFNMPQDNIERAIKKGTGEIEGAILEELLLEAFGPGGVSILIQAVTDNKNRSLSEIKKIIENFRGKMASGSVIWKFKKKGVISFKFDKKEKEELELLAIEEGAEDIKEKENILEIYIKPEKFEDLKKKLEEKKIDIESSSIEFLPKEEIETDEETKNKLETLFNSLDENEDVQEIYSDLKT
ncbi:MAG: YebC/PmpR family DNA-binding transcriptional regulator [Candidatus Pacebacteria bacterium]|nr:YebC/PmpR family DNA-binding transcriptional regulator [Candidatus Paceibacterota bacterium]